MHILVCSSIGFARLFSDLPLGNNTIVCQPYVRIQNRPSTQKVRSYLSRIAGVSRFEPRAILLRSPRHDQAFCVEYRFCMRTKLGMVDVYTEFLPRTTVPWYCHTQM
jgi:hypothetical protein